MRETSNAIPNTATCSSSTTGHVYRNPGKSPTFRARCTVEVQANNLCDETPTISISYNPSPERCLHIVPFSVSHPLPNKCAKSSGEFLGLEYVNVHVCRSPNASRSLTKTARAEELSLGGSEKTTYDKTHLTVLSQHKYTYDRTARVGREKKNVPSVHLFPPQKRTAQTNVKGACFDIAVTQRLVFSLYLGLLVDFSRKR